MLESSKDPILQEDLELVAKSKSIPWDALENRSILITGATGLIGSQIIKALVCRNRLFNSGIKILACVRDAEKAKRIYADIVGRPELVFVTGDVTKQFQIEERVDYIIHTASTTASKEFVTKPVEVIRTTLEGTQNILELAKQNEKIIGVTPAMPTGCSMNIMMHEMPERTFDVGIAEGHAVTFSGGMAKEGLLPFCNIYSAFAQRAFDNIIHDLAILKLNVVLCLDRAGLVGEDGPTHHGAFDLAALRPIPNLTIAAPMDEHELRRMMYTAQLPDKGPFVIRYPRGCGSLVDWRCPLEEIPVGKGRRLRDGNDLAIITLGPIGTQAAAAIEECSVCGDSVATNKTIAHYDLRFLKPLDEDLLHEIGKKFTKIITVEDGVRNGGMGSAVLEWMSDHGYQPVVRRLGLPDHFVEHGKVSELQAIVGIDKESIKKEIESI